MKIIVISKMQQAGEKKRNLDSAYVVLLRLLDRISNRVVKAVPGCPVFSPKPPHTHAHVNGRTATGKKLEFTEVKYTSYSGV